MIMINIKLKYFEFQDNILQIYTAEIEHGNKLSRQKICTKKEKAKFSHFSVNLSEQLYLEQTSISM